MNFRPGSRPRLFVCHSRRAGFSECWPTIGFLHDRVAEVVDHRCDREDAPEPLDTELTSPMCFVHLVSWSVVPRRSPAHLDQQCANLKTRRTEGQRGNRVGFGVLSVAYHGRMEMPVVPRELEAMAALREPTRRRLYQFVERQVEAVSRDEAAAEVGISRALAAFHLDKLVELGLLRAEYRRLSGRSGPGAGRTSKLYCAPEISSP